MSSSFQVILSLTGLTGLSSAIGVPIALYSGAEVKDAESNRGGGGNFKALMDVKDLKRCIETDIEEGEAVDFGTGGKEGVCWEVEKLSGDSQMEIDEEEKYTHLFHHLWDNKEKTWSQYNEYWNSVCPDIGNQWIFIEQVVGKEFLGICENAKFSRSTKPNDQWIVVEKQQQHTPIVKVCRGDCFIDKSSDEWKQWVSSTERGKWHTIKFQKGKK